VLLPLPFHKGICARSFLRVDWLGSCAGDGFPILFPFRRRFPVFPPPPLRPVTSELFTHFPFRATVMHAREVPPQSVGTSCSFLPVRREPTPLFQRTQPRPSFPSPFSAIIKSFLVDFVATPFLGRFLSSSFQKQEKPRSFSSTSGRKFLPSLLSG